MGYYPEQKNLTPLSPAGVEAINKALPLAAGKTPYKFVFPTDGLEFWIDKGMNLDNGVMGYTKFFSKKILISQIIAEQLFWQDREGVPNNEAPMGIVIHELTHRYQMKWLFGLAWLFVNIPGIDMIIENQARKNGDAATEILSKEYREMSKRITGV